MPEDLHIGSQVSLVIHDFTVGGEAVGRVDNFVLFIPGGAPGDEAEVQVTELKKNYGRARITKIIKPSVQRVMPRCPMYHDCGGCHLQHVAYEAQLQFKTKMAVDAMQHIAGLDQVRVRSCKHMENPWNYRGKVQMVVGAKPYLRPKDKADEQMRYRPYAGFYAQGTHSIVKIDNCCIQDEQNNRVISAAREAMERLNWPVYNPQDGSGMIRYLVARSSKKLQETLLVVVSSQPRLPQINEFVDMVRKRVKHLRGVVLNLNPHHSNVVLGMRNQVLWGSEFLIEEVAGIKFHVSANSFFQVNVEGLECIYRALDDYLDIKPKDMVLDAYCGVGSLALYVARRAKRVVGIDECQAAIEDAVINSDLNEYTNTDFIYGTVERVLPGLYHKGQKFRSAIIDPPRKGCDPVVLETIVKMRIPNLVYVSCNPSTLARDLGVLCERGYRVEEIQPIDMFPQTYHVECVAKISRK